MSTNLDDFSIIGIFAPVNPHNWVKYRKNPSKFQNHWDFFRKPGEKSLEDNPENSNEEKNISFYEGFDLFCEKEDIREEDEDIFYGAAFEQFNREWQGEEDVMEKLRMYEKRMGYDKDTMRSMRYQMSMYDEFLEEYEARKKQWGTEFKL